MSQDAKNPWFKRKLKGIITPSTEKKRLLMVFGIKHQVEMLLKKQSLKITCM